MSSIKNGIIFCLLIISFEGFAALVIPSPKIPLDEKASQQFREFQKAKDYKKLRALAIEQGFAFYDQYVKDFKRLNNTEIDPFDKNIREGIPHNVLKAPNAFFDTSDIELFKDQQKTYTELLKAKMSNAQKKDESTGINGSLIYILAIILSSISVFLFQRNNKKFGK